jgi:hypothetical protein
MGDEDHGGSWLTHAWLILKDLAFHRDEGVVHTVSKL